MSASREFVGAIVDGINDRIEAQGNRPNIEVWPDEDGFGRWVACHRDKVRSTVCSTPEYADTPFCGRGFH